MKKTILAATLAASLLSGCSMMGSEGHSYEELKKEGQALLLASNGDGYSPSNIKNLEVARLGVNSVFLVAEPMYERYTETLLSAPKVSNFMAATEAAESEEDKKAIYDALSEEDKIIVNEYLNSSLTKEAMKGAKEVANVIKNNSEVFLALDTKSLLSQVSFANLAAEKGHISHTKDQLAYLDATLVSAYQNYKVVSAFSNAQ